MSAIGKASVKPKTPAVVSKGPHIAVAAPKKHLIKLPEDSKVIGRKLSERKTPAELKEEIKDLLSDLEGSTDPDEKKRIRRALRVRGHRGGLGEKKLITMPDAEVKDTKVAAPKPKGKRAAAKKESAPIIDAG